MIGNPFPLKTNAKKSFQGSIVLGKGFVLTSEEAVALIAKDPRNKEVLFPYLNGDDLNNDPEQKPGRWVINFFDWSEEKARSYPDCFEIVERLVKHERMRQNDKGGKEKWWQFLRPRNELYKTISQLDQVMAIALTSKTVAIAKLPANQVFSHSLGVFSMRSGFDFACLQSSVHNVWAWTYGSSMKSDLRYTPSVCFETFPLPTVLDKALAEKIATVAGNYQSLRGSIMNSAQIGLTKTYNLFHECTLTAITAIEERLDDKDFEKKYGKECSWLRKKLKHSAISYNEMIQMIYNLRSLHIEMDNHIIYAYGWTDINLSHDFQEVEYLPKNDRIRFTIQQAARKKILKRLLDLNYEIYSKSKPIKETGEKCTQPIPTVDLFSGQD